MNIPLTHPPRHPAPSRKRLPKLALTLATVFTLFVAVAQAADIYPSKPIRVINPHGAGGGTDIVIRMVGERIQTMWGQPLVIDSRPGANTAIGMEAASKAAPDGYTLGLCTQASHGSNPAVYPKLRYDPLGDFVPVIALTDVTLYLLVRADSPYKTLADVLAAAKTKPDALTYGSIGVGSLHHLASELLKHRTGTQILHVPYKSSNDMSVGLLGGQVDMIFHSTPLQMVQAGQARVLGVSTRQRWPITPEYPTLMEQGVPDYDVRGWFAVCARTGTPQAILDRMNRDMNTILKEPDIARRLRETGMRPMGGSLQEAHDLAFKEINFWKAFVKSSGVKLESP